MNPKKRKLRDAAGKQSKEKKQRKKELLPDQLGWKEVKRPKEVGLDEFEGMLMLEEVDDVEVIYEETDHGRIAKFIVSILILNLQTSSM